MTSGPWRAADRDGRVRAAVRPGRAGRDYLQLDAELAVFVLVAAVSLGYVGTRVFGPFGGGYRVTVRMADTGGLSVGAQVTYRGVPAGEVESITLEPSYVRVILELDGTHRIPANAAASVVMDSAIRIQHVDLRPSSPAGPYLRDGSVVTAANPTDAAGNRAGELHAAGGQCRHG